MEFCKLCRTATRTVTLRKYDGKHCGKCTAALMHMARLKAEEAQALEMENDLAPNMGNPDEQKRKRKRAQEPQGRLGVSSTLELEPEVKRPARTALRIRRGLGAKKTGKTQDDALEISSDSDDENRAESGDEALIKKILKHTLLGDARTRKHFGSVAGFAGSLIDNPALREAWKNTLERVGEHEKLVVLQNADGENFILGASEVPE